MPLTEDEVRVIVTELSRRIAAVTPDWTDPESSDPGVTLVQLFAFLLESLTNRTGRLPEATAADLRRAIAALAGLSAVTTAGGTLTRNHYFGGRLLGVNDFQIEQDYGRAKHRRHNLHLHGIGVVSGLDVSVGEATSGQQAVTVAPGYAIAPDGEELLIETPQTCALGAQPAAVYVLVRYVETATAVLPTGEASRIVESAAISIDEVVPDAALAIARLEPVSGGWSVDASFRPPQVPCR